MTIPMVCMSVGALALSGIFPFSGFFSKEAILGVLAQHPNKLWLGAGLLGALMTAYYTFRLIFFMLFPQGEVHHASHHDSGHGHGEEGGDHHGYVFWSMAVPVMILAGITLVLGFSQSSLEQFLMSTMQGAHGSAADGHHAEHGAGHYMLLVSAVSLAVGGIVWAYMEFGRKGASQEGFLRKIPAVEELFARRWYLDDLLRKALDNVVYSGLTNIFTRNDRRVIDGGIDGICAFTVGSGRFFSFMQSGMLQQNLLVMIAAVGLVVMFFLFS